MTSFSRRDEPADRGERLGERAHDQVDVRPAGRSGRQCRAPVGPSTPSECASSTNSARAVLLRQLDELRQGRDVALHREHAVDGDQRAALLARTGARAPASRSRDVVVAEAHRLAERQRAAVDDRGVVELVDEDGVVAADQALDDAEVGLVAGREDERGLVPHEFGEVGLELLVQVERAVQEAAAGAAGAVAARARLARPRAPSGGA